MSETKKKAIVWAVIFSECGHVFCCVLPTLFSLFSLMAGAGMISVMPGFMMTLHDMMHGYEVPMIITSGVVLVIGWGLHWHSRRIDCHDTGCCHGPCEPQKDKVKLLLIGATVLFAVNLTVYMTLHRAHDAERAAMYGHHEE